MSLGAHPTRPDETLSRLPQPEPSRNTRRSSAPDRRPLRALLTSSLPSVSSFFTRSPPTLPASLRHERRRMLRMSLVCVSDVARLRLPKIARCDEMKYPWGRLGMSASRAAVFGLVLSVAATGLVGCGSDSSGSSHDGGAGGSGGAAGGGSGDVAGSSTAGTSTAGGASGAAAGGARPEGGASGRGSGGRSSGASGGGASGGSSACPPECFVANQCVTTCGQTPTSYGCCPCPAGMVNALTCAPVSDAGAGAVSCDTRSVLCKRLAPTCAPGEVPSVVGQCYGPCVKIDACACTIADECPNPDEYTCHLSQKRCGPFV